MTSAFGPRRKGFGLDRPAALLSAIESIALSRRFKRSLCGQDWFLSKLKKEHPQAVDAL